MLEKKMKMAKNSPNGKKKENLDERASREKWKARH